MIFHAETVCEAADQPILRIDRQLFEDSPISGQAIAHVCPRRRIAFRQPLSHHSKHRIILLQLRQLVSHTTQLLIFATFYLLQSFARGESHYFRRTLLTEDFLISLHVFLIIRLGVQIGVS